MDDEDDDEVVVEEIVEEEVIAIDIAETASGVLQDNASLGTAEKSLFFDVLFLTYKNKNIDRPQCVSVVNLEISQI